MSENPIGASGSEPKNLKPNSKEAVEQLQAEVEALLAPLGYELVALEQSLAGGRRIVLFIDFLADFPAHESQAGDRRIGLDDCVAVNNAVDELFETTPLLDGQYTLEVSSPGAERPLRKLDDYRRFAGKKAKLHTFRPLDSDELGNAAYWEKNKKQKNFVGTLEGVEEATLSGGERYRIKLNVDGQAVTIPLELISKAHLEMEWNL